MKQFIDSLNKKTKLIQFPIIFHGDRNYPIVPPVGYFIKYAGEKPLEDGQKEIDQYTVYWAKYLNN